MASIIPEPEFSRPIVAERIGAAIVTEMLTAKPDERKALAKRLGLVELETLSARVTLQRDLSGLIHVEGRLEADVVQNCVVTLVDFQSHVEDGFALDFGNVLVENGDEIVVDPDYDPPEPIEDGAIDIGELVTQYLSLALDPHPRAPDAVLEPALTPNDPAELSPFAVLKTLKTPH